MPDPLTLFRLGLAGVSAAKTFSRKKRRPYTPGTFNFTPNENDPELALTRSNILTETAEDRSDTLNELNRAGLLGSSAAFGVMGAAESRKGRALQSARERSYARQRLEALEQFKEQEDFKRKLSLMELEDYLETGRQSNILGLQGLGDIGGFLGEDLEEYLMNLSKKKTTKPSTLRDALSRSIGGEIY